MRCDFAPMSGDHENNRVALNRKLQITETPMNNGRSQLIWISRNGTGRVVQFHFHALLLVVLASLMCICVVAVFFLQSGLFSLADKVAGLEKERHRLQAEVNELNFVKKTLARLEEKDQVLRAYFGMENFDTLPVMAFGGAWAGHLLDREASVASQGKARGLGQRIRRIDQNQRVLSRLRMEQDLARDHTPSVLPVSGDHCRITSKFGWRQNPFTERREFHSGLDISGSRGTRILAPASGIVVRKGYDDWLGNYLVIQHTATLKTIYGHLDQALVSKGTRVHRGQRIGLMGNTGMSTSRHLHYTVIADGRAVDPMQYVLDANG